VFTEIVEGLRRVVAVEHGAPRARTTVEDRSVAVTGSSTDAVAPGLRVGYVVACGADVAA
jgi:DNA-binding transcriptional MocR family regulator